MNTTPIIINGVTFAAPLHVHYMLHGEPCFTRRELRRLHTEYMNATTAPHQWGYNSWHAWRDLANALENIARHAYGIQERAYQVKELFACSWQDICARIIESMREGVYNRPVQNPAPEKAEQSARPATFDHASLVDHCAAQFFTFRPENERDTSGLNPGGSVSQALLEAGAAYAKAVACMDSRNLSIARQPHGPHFMPFLSYAYNYTATAVFHRACAMLLHGIPLDLIPPALNWHGWPEYLNNWQEA